MLGFPYPLLDKQLVVEVREFRLGNYFVARRRTNFVKIGVQGAELEEVDGMRALIARNPEIAMIAEFGASHLKRVGIELAS